MSCKTLRFNVLLCASRKCELSGLKRTVIDRDFKVTPPLLSAVCSSAMALIVVKIESFYGVLRPVGPQISPVLKDIKKCIAVFSC